MLILKGINTQYLGPCPMVSKTDQGDPMPGGVGLVKTAGVVFLGACFWTRMSKRSALSLRHHNVHLRWRRGILPRSRLLYIPTPGRGQKEAMGLYLRRKVRMGPRVRSLSQRTELQVLQDYDDHEPS